MSKGALRTYRTGKVNKSRSYDYQSKKKNEIKDPNKGYSRANARRVDRDLLDSSLWP
jgi:hypothetical protein